MEICTLDLVRKRHVVRGDGVVEGIRGDVHQVRVVVTVEVNAVIGWFNRIEQQKSTNVIAFCVLHDGSFFCFQF